LFPPPERGLPSGLFNSGTRAGLAVAGFVLPPLIASFGWRTMFLVLGFGSLLWLAPWLLTVPGSLRPAGHARAGFHLPTFHRNLLGICLGFFSFDYFLYLLLTWLPDYLVQVRHLSLTQAGVYSAIPFVVFTAAEPLGGWIGDYMIGRGGHETRTRKTVITVAFLLGLLLIPAVLANDVRVAIALIACACGVGLSMGNLLAMVQNCAPPAEIAVWVGMQNFAGNCGGILAPLVTGVLISRTGSYLPGFAIAALVLVLGLVPYWFVVGDLTAPEHARRAAARAVLPR
jgi:nitrate/nitrite transporter NarK